MKNKDSIYEKDAEFLRGYIAENGKEPAIPASVGEDVIVNMLEGQKQKKNTRVIARNCFAGVASCAAVFIIIFAVTIVSKMNYKPSVTVTDGGVSYAENYGQIVKMMNDYADSQNYSTGLSGILGFGNKYAATEDAAEESAVVVNGSYAASDSDSTGKGDSASTLNTREEGVDEADIVRTDGKNIYSAISYPGVVVITAVENSGKMKEAAVIDFVSVLSPSDDEHVSCYVNEIFVRDGLLIIMCEKHDYSTEYAKTSSYALIYDVTDVSSPKLVKKLGQDGYYTSSRIVNDRLLMISEDSRYYDNYTEENAIPCDYRDDACETVACSDIMIVDPYCPQGYNIVTSADLSDLSAEPVTKAMLGSGWNVYCTADRLFIYSTKWNENDTVTTPIKAFDISGGKIEYLGSCEPEGSFSDSFNIDWTGEYLRVATTTYTANRLYVYNSSFEQVGLLDGFGEDETIQGIRFMGNTAYIVTFRQTDPLFVIDLSDPAAPRIVGELKMPGFSDYLHPVGENLLLGVGSGGDDEGLDGSGKISLYDVSDPANPVEVSSVIREDTSFLTGYKAFVKVPGENAYIVPMEFYEQTDADEDGDYYYSGTWSAGAVKITVNEDRTLTLSAVYETDFSAWEMRALVINGNVYIDAPDRQISSFSSDGTALDSISLMQYSGYSYAEYDE